MEEPRVLGILDDRSRLCCHLQCYLDETADSLIHGLSQAFHKRGHRASSVAADFDAVRPASFLVEVPSNSEATLRAVWPT